MKIKNKLNLYRFINLKFPQIFEFVFSKFLKNQIKNDFIPNKYLFFENSSTIKNWGDTYSEYFDLKKKEPFKPCPNENDLLPYNIFQCYAGFTYSKINQHLREFCIESDTTSYGTDRITDKIRVMEDEIKQFKLKENVIVIRKISNEFLNNCLLKPLLSDKKEAKLIAP